MKKEKGITLIALVITVIILLILAGVAMSMITGNGGIFTKANEAATVYNQKAQEEAEQVKGLMDKLDQAIESLNSTPPKPITEVITNVNIGDYIDLGTNLLDTKILSGINYAGDSKRPDEIIKTDYRIFYVGQDTDEDEYKGKIFAILADYLPNSSDIVENAAIENVKQVSDKTYSVNGNVYTESNTPHLAAGLAGPYTGNHILVSSLTGDKIRGKNVSVALSPTGDLFEKSYNAKNTDEVIDYSYYFSADESQSIYVPRLIANDANNNAIYGYWLATASNWCHSWAVNETGFVAYSYFENDTYGIRPVVALGSDVNVKWNNTRGVWEVQ